MTTGHVPARVVCAFNPVADGIHDPDLVREKILLLGEHINECSNWNHEKKISLMVSDGTLRLCGYEIIDALQNECEIDVCADYKFNATFGEMQPYLIALADGYAPKALTVSHLCGTDTITRVRALFPHTKIYVSATLAGCAMDVSIIADLVRYCHLDGIVCSTYDARTYRERLPLPLDLFVTEGYATRELLVEGGDPEYFGGASFSLLKEVSGIPVMLLPDPEVFGSFFREIFGKESRMSQYLSI